MIMNKELSIEEKAKAYDEALKKAKDMLSYKEVRREDMEYLFPELKESEGERIKKELILFFTERAKHTEDSTFNELSSKEIIAWLEKQGEETSWKPSKEEMDVLYGLAYITDQYDEHKEEVITRLYQDLKREFFNSSSYENMFPNTEDDVRRRSTIQILEYARSLDTYNQYGKADIDKNIAWLEKQGNNMGISEATKKELEDSLNKALEKETPESCNEFLENQGEHKPKFRIGDTIKKESTGDIVTISEIDLKNREYRLSNTGFIPFKYEHLWELVGQKPNWSEEDEAKLKSILFHIEDVENKDVIYWLKSIKDKYTWKPSDEQMDALRYVTNFDYGGHKAILVSLYEQLKKLKG